MYSLEQAKNKIIWMVREHRSGSYWLAMFLGYALNREEVSFLWPDAPLTKERRKIVRELFKNRQQEPQDLNRILSTHDYEVLESLSNYQEPLVLRTTRKNKTEQLVSRHIASAIQKFHVFDQAERDQILKLEPITVPPEEVRVFCRNYDMNQELWNRISGQYETETIYYEDIAQRYQSKLLDLNISMPQYQFNPQRLPLKMPYNKREIITNYDEIDQMLKIKFGDY